MNNKRFRYIIPAGTVLLLTVFCIGCTGKSISSGKWKRELATVMEKRLYELFMPVALYQEDGTMYGFWPLAEQIESVMPLYGYVERNSGAMMPEEEQEEVISWTEEAVKRAEHQWTVEDVTESDSFEIQKNPSNEQIAVEGSGSPKEDSVAFIPHVQEVQIDLEQLRDYETLVNRFYTIDQNTMAGGDQLNVDRFLEKDMTIQKNVEGPQILIFHTHSRESFADSVEGDSNTSIIGVGEQLAEILRNRYGYRVLHHTEQYDAISRDDAYSRALIGLEQVLDENPSIQVILDLHRDEMDADTRLVMNLDGRPTARFMFFNGLSRTKKTGNIEYLYNENLEDNLAFSFQMQLKAARYYPGLTRKIYLKGYRYNMHLKDKYLLVELGAQNNTVEEAMNACDPLAHILDMVLGGT